jgi:hypothetical protein
LKPNPIAKVLSTLSCHGVKYLLMEGQACVFYGAAEFSRDVDVVIPYDEDNLERLRLATSELSARVIAVPPFAADYLRRGHAVHFRCGHPEAVGMRLDVISVLRGVDAFESLWERRVEIEDQSGNVIPLLGIEDLVKAKKTQREKDLPMIRRQVEAHYAQFRESPTPQQVAFWLLETRSVEILIEVANRFPEETRDQIAKRQFLWRVTPFGHSDPNIWMMELEAELRDERENEMDADSVYWQPLTRELESLRERRLDEKRGNSE